MADRAALEDMPSSWHDHGMPRTRISTTVDSDLLDSARRLDDSASDAELVDRALSALLSHHRGAEIDVAYAEAYTQHPLDEPDEWGDLASWSAAE